jgi:AraC family transcriptional regulator of adaptative response/methylated-DNA-[protein]-cysteine methyltransferase
MWKAVEERDSRSDGQFVYAVRSTGIYCRPSCPSRRPQRDKVEFYSLPEAAEQHGFRACKRCVPRNAPPGDATLRAVSRVCRQIDAAIAQDEEAAALKSSKLAAAANMSAHQLERAFLRLMGITPRQYADAKRMRRLKSQLRKEGNVTTALYDAGFGSSSRLYERAPSHLGMTPRAYRRGGEGMQIHYTIANSPLGRLLVGATEKGISALYLGDSDAALQHALRKEYPRAEISHDAKGASQLRGWLNQILAHLKGREPHLDLPTDVQATAFQRRVWEELRKIPYGSTATYTEVAKRIGRPTAIRAVARACATNPVSIVVPCHRVVREDGNLAGYRWKVARKQALLETEAASKP